MLDLLFGGGPRRRAAEADWWPTTTGRRRTQSGAVVDEDLALTYDAVWCASRIIAETCASLPLFLYRRKDNDDREHATDSPLYPMLKVSPNEQMGSMAFREGRVMHQVNWGNGFAEIERDGQGQVKALWPIHPGRVRPIRPSDTDATGRPLADEFAYSVRNNDGKCVALRADEVLHVPGVLSEDGVWGKGVISYARESIGFGIATERHGATYFGTGGQPRGIAFLPGMKDPAQRKQFRQEWRELHGHPDSAEIAILPPEGKFEKVMVSNEDAQFLGTRKFNVNVIARWYRIPPYMLAELERAGYGSIEHMGLEFVIYSILPWLRRWEEQIALKLLRPEERADHYAEHQLSGLLRGDIRTRMDAYHTAIGTGILTINEARRLENLNGIGPAGDVHYVPLNMTTAERMQAGDPESGHGSEAGRARAHRLPRRRRKEMEASVNAIARDVEAMKLAGAAPVQPNPAANDALRDAARAVLADALGRLHAKEANAVKRFARSVDFSARLAEFHSGHLPLAVEALAPAAALLGAMGVRATAEGMAEQYVEGAAAEMLAAYASDTPGQFAARLEAWSDRSGALAAQLMRGQQ